MMKIKHLRWLLFTCLFFSFQAPKRYLGKAINIIFQDSQDRIWVGTNSEGVFCQEKGIVHHYTTKDGIREAQILAIQEDAQGQIWVQGSHHIYKFEKTLAFSLAQIQHAKPYQPDKNQNKSHLWFGFGGGAYHFDGKVWSYLLLKGSTDAGMPENPTSIKNINPTQLNSYSVYCTLFDKQRNLWLGTQSMGVCCYQADGTFKWLTEKGLKGPAVRAMFQDSKGNYWFGNNGGGLFFYDGQQLLNMTETHGLANPNFIKDGKPKTGTLARVWAINEDSQGQIWVATYDSGLWKYDAQTFTNYTLKDGLPSLTLTAILKAHNGKLLIGSDDSGVFEYEK